LASSFVGRTRRRHGTGVPGAGAYAFRPAGRSLLQRRRRIPPRISPKASTAMFDNLTDRLSRVVKSLRGQARLTDENIQDALREVRLALLEADVALPVVKEFVAHVREKAVGAEVVGSLTPGQALIGVVHRELAQLMGGAAVPLDLATQPPAVFLLAGLQGAGKTTTAAKLARLLREDQKKKVLLVSTDVYRPAAIDQLRTLAPQVGADFFPASPDQKPEAIATAAVDWARRHFHDVVIVDTAGRLAIDTAMMDEIRALHAAVRPIETLFVVDAMQGQDAVNTARAFRDALPLTGVILTKLDGDARGGAALSVRHVTGAPIKFAGIAEKVTGLEVFHPERMASRILGMGDVLSLIEEAHRTVDVEKAQKLARKVRTGKGFDLEDYKEQVAQMRKMGGLSALLEKLPAELARAAQGQQVDERKIARVEGIINSMTPAERSKPEIIKASRKRRIAAGAGVSVQEVNQLLSQFEQAQKMMKMVAKGGVQKMMRGMRGLLPGGPR
jgi:signal recognition particle subunit SRP54